MADYPTVKKVKKLLPSMLWVRAAPVRVEGMGLLQRLFGTVDDKSLSAELFGQAKSVQMVKFALHEESPEFDNNLSFVKEYLKIHAPNGIEALETAVSNKTNAQIKKGKVTVGRVEMTPYLTMVFATVRHK